MIKPKLVVVMPYLNNLEMTRQAVLSFGSPDGVLFLLINNGSTVFTEKEFDELHSLKNAAYIDNSFNLGLAPVLNMGMQFAFFSCGCERVILANNDVLVRPETVDNLVKFSQQTGEGFVTAYNIAPLCHEPSDFSSFKIPDSEVVEEHPDFSFILISRSFVETLQQRESNKEPLRGYFDPNFAPAYFEDNDLHRRCLLAGLRCVKTHSAPYYHLQSQTKKSSLNTAAMVNETYIKNFYYYATKWGGDRGEETFTIPFEKPFDAFSKLGANIK